jgi:hypothetical protein
VDETSCEEDNQAGNKVDVGRFRQRKAFLESMLKAESVSKESFARIDQIRNHKLKQLKDLDETKKRDTFVLTHELENKQREFEAIAEKKKEEEYLRNLEFQDKKVKLEKEIRLNKQHISEVTKEYNIGVLFNDQKEEELKNREEDKERYKGEELTMTKDTLKVDTRASENFQIIELKINQEYLKDKTIKEKDDNRLKPNAVHTEEGHRQQSIFEAINIDILMNGREEEKDGNREEGKEKYTGKELSMQKDTSEIEKCASESFQEIEVKISKECLEEKCEHILTGKEQDAAVKLINSLEFEKQTEICNYEKACLMPGNEEEHENILTSKITQGLTKNAGAII